MMLLKLPHELREVILMYVKGEDLTNLSCTSRNYNAELKEFLFGTVQIPLPDLQKADLANADGHLRNLKYAKSLQLLSHFMIFTLSQGCGNIPPNIALILNYCNPRHLKIAANLLTPEIYVQISKLSNLRELSFSSLMQNGDVMDEHVRIVCEGLTTLTSLTIQPCRQLTNKSLKYVGNLLQLEELYLSDIYNVDDTAFSSFSKLHNLKKVYLSLSTSVFQIHQPKLSGNALIHLKGLTKIKELHIGGWVNLDAGMSILGKLTSLKKLQLMQCKTITDENLSHLKDLTQLEYLDLNWCCNITGESFSYLVNLNLLKELHLRACINLTDRAMSYVQNLHQLEKLNLQDCKKISDVSLDYICKLSKLRELNISRCTNITDSGIHALRRLLSIEVLDMFGCDKITDKAMKYIRRMKKLIKLSVDYNLNISNHGLSYLQSLVLLESLTFQGCELISDHGLHYLSKLGNLKSLNLAVCSVTSKGVENLKKQLPLVKDIIFR